MMDASESASGSTAPDSGDADRAAPADASATSADAEASTNAGVTEVPTPDGQVRVHVRALASSGAGVADLPDGRVAFVHLTAPGDEADVRIEKQKKRWATASLQHLRTPGEGRVDPPCPLFGTCGGCTLQHLAYTHQTTWKGRFVADALTRIGDVETEPPQVTPSPEPYHYRNRITITLRRLRGGRLVAGFHALDRPGHVVDMTNECLLPETPIMDVWRRLRAHWGGGARRLPEGGRLRLTLAMELDGAEPGDGARGVSLLVEGGASGWRAGDLFEQVPGLTGVWHLADDADEPVLVDGQGTTSPGSFRQVNDHAADLLRAHVVERAGTPDRVVDAYCGSGAYGRLLAATGSRVTGIESEPHACARARTDAPEGFEVVEARVEDALEGALPADLVIVNPPRTGLDEGVADVLARHRPERIIYVSCDPATLARDVARLRPGYAVAGLRSFDLFPQTAHVETVAVLHATEGGDANETPNAES